MAESRRLDEAVAALRARGIDGADLGLVLGSGLRGFAERLSDPLEVPFGEVPHWPVPRVEGHGGSLTVGRLGTLRVACLSGRVHLYEGWSPAEVARPLRTLARLGVGRMVITNAAGGIDPSFSPGDLMLIVDHLNLTGQSALLGDAEPALGPRFPDQTAVYSPALRAVLRGLDADLVEGVYAGNLGPAYETPAEVRMLAAMGAHAVGMSTVLEASAVAAMGVELAGISLISNLAAGIGERPLSHDEVIAEGARAARRFADLLDGFCRATASTP